MEIYTRVPDEVTRLIGHAQRGPRTPTVHQYGSERSATTDLRRIIRQLSLDFR